jgi:Holliday junction resolvase-like predicted endonuclease
VVIGRNVRCPPGEIDLVVEWHGARVAVEVRCRRGGDPIEEITDRKLDHVRCAARVAGSERLDLVAVRLDEFGASVRWIPGV